MAYGHQNEPDYQAFVVATKTGVLTAETGVWMTSGPGTAPGAAMVRRVPLKCGALTGFSVLATERSRAAAVDRPLPIAMYVHGGGMTAGRQIGPQPGVP